MHVFLRLGLTSHCSQSFKATSMGVSASFMLLFLAQLMVRPCAADALSAR